MKETPAESHSHRFRAIPLPLTIAFAACGAGAGLIAFLILRYAVPIPMLDDWEMVPLATKAHTGGLSFEDLFAQQQEARPFFPKLVFIALSFAKYWDSRIAMIFSLLICCFTAFGIYRLLRRSGLENGASALAFVLATLLIFSPAQHEVWLLASGFPSFIPAFCIVCGLVIATSTRPIAWKFGWCLALSVVASFTLAHGLLVWGLTFPMVVFTERETTRRWLAYWTGACALCLIIYFWRFRPPNDLPAFAPPVSIISYFEYVAAFLGSGLGRAGNEAPLQVSIAIGAVLLAGYIGAVIHVARRRRDREHCRRVVPWIALGGYSIGSAILAALGRIEWGVSQALESRYVAFSIYLAIALVALTTLLAGSLFRSTSSPGRRRIVLAVVVFVAGGYVALDLMCGAASLPMFRIRSAVAALGRSGVLFAEALDTSKAICAGNHPRAHFVRQNADALDQLRLLRTRLVRTAEIGQIRHDEASGNMASGWWDGLTHSDAESTAWGWAALVGHNRPADGVLLAYANDRGDWIAFALSDAVVDRPDVAKSLNKPEQLWSGWRATFARKAVPVGAELSAWAIDAKDAKVYRLRTSIRMVNL